MKSLSQNRSEQIALALLRIPAVVIMLVLGLILYDIISKGIGVINWEFLTDKPRNLMREGGIFPMIMGTIYLSVGALLVALPLGILCAVYLTEYAKPDSRAVRIINLAITNLAGVPSIVLALLGLALFVNFFGFGTSILSGALVLGIMILPIIIKASQEALLAIPQGFREGSLALGGTKWQTITENVIPYATPGMMTGSILGLSRAAGETAPILFTAAVFYMQAMPSSPLDPTMALPFHLYFMATQSIFLGETRPQQYATALVLLSLVLLLNLAAILIRNYYRKKYRW